MVDMYQKRGKNVPAQSVQVMRENKRESVQNLTMIAEKLALAARREKALLNQQMDNLSDQMIVTSFKQYPADPQQLSSQLESMQAKLLDQIPDQEEQRSFSERFEKRAAVFLDKAYANFEKQQTSQLKQAALEGLGWTKEALDVAVANWVSGDIEAHDQRLLEAYLTKTKGALEVVDGMGKRIFSDFEAQKWHDQLQQDLLQGFQKAIEEMDEAELEDFQDKMNKGAFEGDGVAQKIVTSLKKDIQGFVQKKQVRLKKQKIAEYRLAKEEAYVRFLTHPTKSSLQAYMRLKPMGYQEINRLNAYMKAANQEKNQEEVPVKVRKLKGGGFEIRHLSKEEIEQKKEKKKAELDREKGALIAEKIPSLAYRSLVADVKNMALKIAQKEGEWEEEVMGVAQKVQESDLEENQKEILIESVGAVIQNELIARQIAALPELAFLEQPEELLENQDIRVIEKEILHKKEMKKIGNELYTALIQAILAGEDQETVKQVYENGMQRLLREKYHDLPAIQFMKFEPDELIHINGRVFRYKGVDEKDILVQEEG